MSVLAALGVGQLAAGLVAPASAPVLAVADAVVRLSPRWLTEIGKGLEFPALGLVKGVADKVALLAGIGAVVLVLAAAAGVASRRRPLAGRMLIVALGAAGLAAVVSSPVFGPAHLLAPLAALAVGLAAFDALRILATEPSVDGEPRLQARRGVLLGIAAVGAGALATGLGGLAVAGARTTRPGTITAGRPAPPVPPGADFAQVGTPAFITDNRDFYRIDTAIQVPQVSAEDWSLRVHGMVDTPLRLGYDDLLAGPLLERTITLTCVSNEVNGGLISTANFTGVSLRELLLRAGPRPGADQIHSTSVDGWTAGTPTDVVMRPDSDALLAVAMNGQPLPPEHGYPVRMVVPGLYGFVSATKWLTDLELTTFEATQAYWTRRGWAERAPIKTQSRIDRPRPLATVTPGPNGRVTLAGIAWAQTRGIDKVEVRLDEAGAWRPAQLSAQVNRATWRMWRLDVPLAPGSHFVQCRATDATGTTQTPQPAPPIPDGAAGWPGIRFTVA